MIPDWNILGLLPPIRPGLPGNNADRSPYVANLHQVVERFATPPERTAILSGLLGYRHELHQLGIVAGFQWLDGSFMEQVEVLDSRAPRDVDVITFFSWPAGIDQQAMAAKHKRLFMSQQTKALFKVDGYPCILGESMEGRHVRQIAYWYSMWSHKRSGTWKGFVQVDLSPQEDAQAQKVLDLIAKEGGLS
ncbi:MAG: hypothetical protein NTW55_03065 [Planctomycetota bacterium]|nr:hypothetical protein [Planctomycetota bacterium]